MRNSNNMIYMKLLCRPHTVMNMLANVFVQMEILKIAKISPCLRKRYECLITMICQCLSKWLINTLPGHLKYPLISSTSSVNIGLSVYSGCSLRCDLIMLTPPGLRLVQAQRLTLSAGLTHRSLPWRSCS